MNTNITTAKAYPITAYLAAQGIQPERASGNAIFYKSPFRAEKTASFCVYVKDNKWVDFGQSNRAQDVISLVMQLERCTFKEAIKKLQGSNFEPMQITTAHTTAQQQQNGVMLQKVKPLENRLLLQYVESRGINPQLVRLTVPQLKEAYYYTAKHPTGKPLFAVAFANDKGGYELRNGIGNNGKGFQGCSGVKAITTVHGTEGKSCIVFEGFFDFLSYLQIGKVSRLKNDAIILNSVNTAATAAPALAKYEKVFLCLDRDEPADTATQLLQSILPQAQDIRSRVITHPKAKDVNDQLLRNK